MTAEGHEYFCDSSKVTHFSEVNGPGSNVVQLHPDGSE
jgi:hypothetical protein